MTFYEDGLLYRAESRLGNEYIAIKLVIYQLKTPTPAPRPHTIWIQKMNRVFLFKWCIPLQKIKIGILDIIFFFIKQSFF